MTKLSVNINKFATLRNSRGGDRPNVVQAAVDAQRFGADGVTVHPRPDERHITYKDVYDIRPIITTEFNIEGNPREQKFIDLVLAVKPHQVTFVPDEQGQITSNHGWDTIAHKEYLTDTVALFHQSGIRVSLFVDPQEKIVEAAAATGADRVELYTADYAIAYEHYLQSANKTEMAQSATIAQYIAAAKTAKLVGLGLNAGHDLDRHNLSYFSQSISWLDEVSIGHALVCDALYLGFENAIQLYQRALGK